MTNVSQYVTLGSVPLSEKVLIHKKHQAVSSGSEF